MTVKEQAPRHTPGPWHYGVATNYQGFYVAPETYPTLAAVQVFNYPENTEANARLIAAAPELLAACYALYQLVMTGCGCRVDILDAARGAIKKAEGRE